MTSVRRLREPTGEEWSVREVPWISLSAGSDPGGRKEGSCFMLFKSVSGLRAGLASEPGLLERMEDEELLRLLQRLRLAGVF